MYFKREEEKTNIHGLINKPSFTKVKPIFDIIQNKRGRKRALKYVLKNLQVIDDEDLRKNQTNDGNYFGSFMRKRSFGF